MPQMAVTPLGELYNICVFLLSRLIPAETVDEGNLLYCVIPGWILATCLVEQNGS